MLRSFYFAGFECATGYNVHGDWIDQIAATQHDKHVESDYRRLQEVGIQTAREAVRWPYVDYRGHYDFSSVQPFLEAAEGFHMEIIWDLFHYGYPEDIDLFTDEFPKRFADYCHATATFLKSRQDAPYYFTPVNEPSYLSWAAGGNGRFSPHRWGRARELKIALAKACIQGINAIRDVIPAARIVNVDPICRVVPPKGKPETSKETKQYNENAIFESWDLVCGRLMPELGGSRKHLDIVGMNYYWTNQWELGKDEQPLEAGDPRLSSLSRLVKDVWKRYGGELMITETGHVADRRAAWMQYVKDETRKLLQEGVPLRGVCLYPILGMPEWHVRQQWTSMGLWDLDSTEPGLRRRIHKPMLDKLREAQQEAAILLREPRTGRINGGRKPTAGSRRRRAQPALQT